MRRTLILLLSLSLLSCATTRSFEGDPALLKGVPRHTVEREKRLLEQRMNSWARELDATLREEKTTWPDESGKATSLRGRIENGRVALRLLERKLAAYPNAIDFTPEEWVTAEDAHCKLQRNEGPIEF